MGSYIESNLGRDEKILEKAHVSWLSQFWYILIGILTLPVGVGVLFLLLAFINVWTTELAITNRRIIAKTGLIRRNTIELKVTRVESLGVDQSILGRIFNFGSIIVKGTGGSNAPIPYIAKPLDFRQRVNHYLDELDDNSSIEI
ncbi:PH domain-containing protein [Acinetobacter pollinis]|uniref:PH domain-containing protein n=1 Tax=Acinetobacter pollinis TaxID=2605270 RepID=UPI0018A2BBBD|nr:PH domain-containing protein [Acinetobacter pollinis]MBF7691171.1 PH domain-containing protein [Acinetobacter pollinis]MBF7698889.1 PH domain-containing protein [Acinetobacter pollinis]